VLTVLLQIAYASLSAQVPVITEQPASRTVGTGCTISFSVGVATAGQFTYQWQHEGTNLPNGIITTVAGSGQVYDSGDGVGALSAGFGYPCGVAVDTLGNLYVGDIGAVSNSVRKISTNGIVSSIPRAAGSYGASIGLATDAAGNLFVCGIITTLAGGGTERVRDGLEATNVDLYIVSRGLAVDISGNVFFSTFHQVLKVDTNGIITTVAGDTPQGCTGDGSCRRGQARPDGRRGRGQVREPFHR
jgi:hypothetical protein